MFRFCEGALQPPKLNTYEDALISMKNIIIEKNEGTFIVKPNRLKTRSSMDLEMTDESEGLKAN